LGHSVYTKLNLRVCVSVLCSLCTASFERIFTKFGMWHPYTLQMSWGLVSAVSARGIALSVPEVTGATDLGP